MPLKHALSLYFKADKPSLFCPYLFSDVSSLFSPLPPFIQYITPLTEAPPQTALSQWCSNQVYSVSVTVKSKR